MSSTYKTRPGEITLWRFKCFITIFTKTKLKERSYALYTESVLLYVRGGLL